MTDIIINLLIGIISGVISGMLPGIGNTVTLTLLFPYLITLDPISLLALYIALVSSSQYIGSIAATIFAIPGESSSLPAVREGNALFRNGNGSVAISGAALGSFFGSTIVVLLTFLIVPWLENMVVFFTTNVQATILILVILSLCINPNQKFLISFVLAIFGFLLGMIGCTRLDYTCYGTSFFGYTPTINLTGGLPVISVIAALYVVPQIIRHWPKNEPSNTVDFFNLNKERFVQHLDKFFKSYPTVIRSSIIGYFAGLAPGFSQSLASHLSYSIERKIEYNKKNYIEGKGNYNSLLAAETSNNAAAFTTLIPLLVFGIPLSASESIIYELSASKAFVYGNVFSFDFFVLLAMLLCIVNIISLIIAWPFAKYLCYFYKIPMKYIYIFVLAVIVYIVYNLGAMQWAAPYYLGVFFILLPIGFLLRNYDTLPLIFTFIVQDRIYIVFSRLYQLHF